MIAKQEILTGHTKPWKNIIRARENGTEPWKVVFHLYVNVSEEKATAYNESGALKKKKEVHRHLLEIGRTERKGVIQK